MDKLTDLDIHIAFRVVIFLIIAWIIGFTIINTRNEPDEPLWNRETVVYYPELSGSAFEQLWVKKDVYLKYLEAGNGVFFIGSLDAYGDLALISLDASNGNEKWHQGEIPPTADNAFEDNKKYIYISGSGDGTIAAYWKETGKIAWNYKPSLPTDSLVRVVTENDLLVGYTGSDIFVSRLDAETGAIKVTDSDFSRAYWDDQIIMDFTSGSLRAHDAISGNPVWSITLDSPDLTFVENRIFVRAAPVYPGAKETSQLIVLDKASGEIVWQLQEHIIGDIAIGDGVIYGLTPDSSVIALDAETGKRLAELHFMPTFLEFERNSGVPWSFAVAAQDDLLFVYITSGQQLFAFRFLQEN